MANQQYAEFHKMSKSLPGQIAQYFVAGVDADMHALTRYAEIIAEIAKRANLRFETDADIVFSKEVLKNVMSAPQITALLDTVFMPTSMKGKFNLSVSSSDSSSLSSATDAEVKGSATFGFGLFKGTASMSAKQHVGLERARKSDQSSLFEVEFEMGRIPAAEGVMKMVDGQVAFAESVNDLNKLIVQKKVDQILAEVPDVDPDSVVVAQPEPDKE